MAIIYGLSDLCLFFLQRSRMSRILISEMPLSASSAIISSSDFVSRSLKILSICS